MAIENYGLLKLLFVDDDSLTRLLLRELLNNSYWRNSVIVESAAAAYDAIMTSPPDVVFTDWQMPNESGLDLIRAIRERPNSPEPLLPVFLLTASGDAEHVRAGRDAGAAGFLVKPISVRGITERVIDVVTRERWFIVSPGYTRPDRQRANRPAKVERRSRGELPAGVVVLPPDGLLKAKVSGDATALRKALRRHANSVALFRAVSPSSDVRIQ
jgi:DNA-binding response OmpR family regulator